MIIVARTGMKQKPGVAALAQVFPTQVLTYELVAGLVVVHVPPGPVANGEPGRVFPPYRF